MDPRWEEILDAALSEAREIEGTIPDLIEGLRYWIKELNEEILAAKEHADT